MMMSDLPSSARLLLQAVGPLSDLSALASLTKAEKDWPVVLQLAQRHGFIPLLQRRLKELGRDAAPPEILNELQEKARVQAGFALLLTGELLTLLALCAAHDIPAVPYKGPALAAQFYGDPTLRYFTDLDLLVRECDLAHAQKLLAEQGWEAEQLFAGAQGRAFVRHYDSYKYYRSEVLTELHWRVAERRFMFPLTVDELWQQAVPLQLMGREVRAPSPADTLLIICFHGAKHLWERLGWLCDVAYLLAACPDLDWEQVLARAKRLGSERVLWISLGLAQQFFQAPLPEAIARRVATDAPARALAGQLAASWFLPRPVSWNNYERAQFHVKMRERWLERVGYRLRVALRTTADDWQMLPFPLPGFLFFLYYPLRAARLLNNFRRHRETTD